MLFTQSTIRAIGWIFRISEPSQSLMSPARSCPRCSSADLRPLLQMLLAAGFVGGKSPTDKIFTLRHILQKCRECQIFTDHLFADFKAAYDTIDRKELWSIMQRYRFPEKLIRLLETTMKGVQCKVRVSNLTSEAIESHRGLRQGD